MLYQIINLPVPVRLIWPEKSGHKILLKGAGSLGHYDYDAYGNLTGSSGTDPNANYYRYSGKEYIPSVGMYNYGYRFYSPGLGRWINRDPIGESGGLNVYAFVGNNPVNFGDAYGLREGDWWDLRTYRIRNFEGGVDEARKGAYAALDGADPFGDPLADEGYYNPCRYRFSHNAGMVGGAALAGAAGGILAGGSVGAAAVEAGVGAAAQEETTTLYRAVSPDEVIDIAQNGLRQGVNAMGGKWFAESPEGAANFGRMFYQRMNGSPFFTLQMTIPTDLADQMMANPNLDGLGAARYAEPEMLKAINRVGQFGVLNGNMVPR